MKVLIRYGTRKSRGDVAVRDEWLECDSLLIGRSTASEIQLMDPRVLLEHARVTVRSGEAYVEALNGGSMSVNGNLADTAKVSELDVLHIGPFQVIIEPNKDDSDITVSIELISPLGDELENLKNRAKINVTSVGLSKRKWSWIAFATVLTTVLIWPMVVSWIIPDSIVDVQNAETFEAPMTPTAVWTSGGISAAHKFFGEGCEVCHERPFVPVQDNACVACHQAIENHTDSIRFPSASFGDQKCQSCHKEHQGDRTVARNDQEFCTDCHANLIDHEPATTLRSVRDFGTEHPEFIPTIITDASLHTMSREKTISDPIPPKENSGLTFPHSDHLRKSGVQHPTQGIIELGCRSCHVPDEGNIAMLPVTFERHCHQCHTLNFDVQLPGREMIHGEPKQLFMQISDIYNAAALRGGYEEPNAPEVIRRRPGTPIKEADRAAARNWADEKSENILNGRFGKGQCNECHDIVDNPTTGIWAVKPVYITEQWFPKAHFDHGSHGGVSCRTCHSAETSADSSEVLMPAIDTCQSCHGGETVSNRVPSTCVTCHDFHTHGMSPLRPTESTALESKRGFSVISPDAFSHIAKLAP